MDSLFQAQHFSPSGVYFEIFYRDIRVASQPVVIEKEVNIGNILDFLIRNMPRIV